MDEQTSSSKNSMAPIAIAAVIIILIAIAGGYFILSNKKAVQKTMMQTSSTPTQSMMQSPTEQITATQSGMMGGKNSTGSGMMQNQTIEVTGQNYSFNPKSITVKVNEPVTINFKSVGGTHDFYLDEFNVKSNPINSGQSEKITFTPTKKGTFQYYCSIGNHRQMGMVGNLIVQ